MVSANYAKQRSLLRNPIRELDEHGRPYVIPGDIEPMGPEPVVVNQVKRKRFHKKKAKQETIIQRNVANSFITQVTRILNKKTPSMIVLEGERLIADAHDAGADITQVFYTHERHLKSSPVIKSIITNIKQDLVSESDMKLVSRVVTPPGIIAICKKPSIDSIKSKRDSRNIMPLTIITDGVRDPGNMGGLIRSASSSGSEQLIAGWDSIDVWNPKVLRGGMGAHFRTPIRSDFSLQELKDSIKSYKKIYYAEADNTGHEEGKPYYHVDYFTSPSTQTALFVGGEAFGFSNDVMELMKECGAEKLSIPMAPGAQCLNSYVAASIILFEMRRQFMKVILMD